MVQQHKALGLLLISLLLRVSLGAASAAEPLEFDSWISRAAGLSQTLRLQGTLSVKKTDRAQLLARYNDLSEQWQKIKGTWEGTLSQSVMPLTADEIRATLTHFALGESQIAMLKTLLGLSASQVPSPSLQLLASRAAVAGLGRGWPRQNQGESKFEVEISRSGGNDGAASLARVSLSEAYLKGVERATRWLRPTEASALDLYQTLATQLLDNALGELELYESIAPSASPSAMPTKEIFLVQALASPESLSHVPSSFDDPELEEGLGKVLKQSWIKEDFLKAWTKDSPSSFFDDEAPLWLSHTVEALKQLESDKDSALEMGRLLAQSPGYLSSLDKVQSIKLLQTPLKGLIQFKAERILQTLQIIIRNESWPEAVKVLKPLLQQARKKMEAQISPEFYAQWWDKAQTLATPLQNGARETLIADLHARSIELAQLSGAKVADVRVDLETLWSVLESDAVSRRGLSEVGVKWLKLANQGFIQGQPWGQAQDQYRQVLDVFGSQALTDSAHMSARHKEDLAILRDLGVESGAVVGLLDRMRSGIAQGVASLLGKGLESSESSSGSVGPLLSQLPLSEESATQYLSKRKSRLLSNALLLQEVPREGSQSDVRTPLWQWLAERSPRELPPGAFVASHDEVAQQLAQAATELRKNLLSARQKLTQSQTLADLAPLIGESGLMASVVSGEYPQFKAFQDQLIHMAQEPIRNQEQWAKWNGIYSGPMIAAMVFFFMEPAVAAANIYRRSLPALLAYNTVRGAIHAEMAGYFTVGWLSIMGGFGATGVRINYYTDQAQSKREWGATSVLGAGFYDSEDIARSEFAAEESWSQLKWDFVTQGVFMGAGALTSAATQRILAFQDRRLMRQFEILGFKSGEYAWNEAAIREHTHQALEAAKSQGDPLKLLIDIYSAERSLLKTIQFHQVRLARAQKDFAQDASRLGVDRENLFKLSSLQDALRQRIEGFPFAGMTKSEVKRFEESFDAVVQGFMLPEWQSTVRMEGARNNKVATLSPVRTALYSEVYGFDMRGDAFLPRSGQASGRIRNPGQFYRILGVPATAKPEEIKSAYRRLVGLHHPDKHPGAEAQATENLRKIKRAYEVLRDAKTRARYDATGEEP